MKHKASSILAIVLVIAGCVLRFAMPGHDFIGYLLWLLAVLIFAFPRLSKTWRIVLAALLVLGAAVFAVFEAPVISNAKTDADPQSDYLIVLGAAVHGDTPSLSLVERLRAAKDYLDAHPNTVAIVSGGQGGGENMSEAQAMYDWLCKSGIDTDRIIKEDKAVSTYENLKFSREIISSLTDKSDPTIAVVSSEYHLCRAKLISKSLDMDIHTVPAHTTYFTVKLNYFIREAFGVTYQLTFA